VHDPNSETWGPCDSESKLESRTGLLDSEYSGYSLSDLGQCPRVAASTAVASNLAGACNVMAGRAVDPTSASRYRETWAAT
jgi:hypothetical protein